jgi:hypothetical protein
VLLVLVAIFAPVLTAIGGQDPTTPHNSSQVLQSGHGFQAAGLPLPGYKLPSSTRTW